MDIQHLWMIMSLTLAVLLMPVMSLSGKVLLVSFDGFRWDYLDIVPGLENFPKFAKEGTFADYMNNTFTTLTFATHYSMATGLYQESHGIVSNYMYDPVLDERFSPGCTSCNDHKWWGGEPIWITATLQGKKVGCMFWAGTEVDFDGIMPELWREYDTSVPFKTRVDTVLDWFKYDDLDLGLVYFHQPDKAGHKYGPRSPEVVEQVQEMDGIMGYMMDGVRSRNLSSSLNILVVSDHGVTNISLDRMIEIPQVVDWTRVDTFVELGAICHVFVKDGELDAVYEQLHGTHASMNVFKRAEIPTHWHYSNNRRIGDILLVMEEGWCCTENKAFSWNTDKGSHGYDNRLMSMKPIFMAQGPDIKSGYEVKPFMSLDIYPLTARLLGITPAPNNGTMDIVESMLIPEPQTRAATETGSSVVASVWSIITLALGILLRNSMC